MILKSTLFFLIILQFGCATYREESLKVRNLFLELDFSNALNELEASSLKEDEASSLLYHLEKSMILDKMKEFEKSRNNLFTADKLADQYYTTSISRTALTLFVNESTQYYVGEDYEKVLIHLMLALSFLSQNDLKSAVVQAKKINTKLHELTQEYDREYNGYAQDGFARYLAGIIYLAKGEDTDALIDLNKALEIFESQSYSNYYNGQVPKNLVSSLYSLAVSKNRTKLIHKLKKDYGHWLLKVPEINHSENSGVVFVIHEVGKISRKIAKEFFIHSTSGFIRFSFPYIEVNRHYSRGRTGVYTDLGGFIKGENVADFNAIAHQCLEDRRGRMILKGTARVITKQLLVEEIRQKYGPFAGLAANIVAVSTESADTRSWTLIPEAFYVTKLVLKPGRHRISIVSNGAYPESRKFEIKPGEVKIFRASS